MKIKLERKQKIIVGGIFLFILFDLILIFGKFAANIYSRSAVFFEGNSVSSEKMRALNKNASSGKISKPGFAYYKFTSDGQKNFSDYYKKNGSVGVSVRIGVKNVKGAKFQAATATEKLFYFGFLQRLIWVTATR